MKNFLTAMGPFFVNTLLGILIVIPASLEILYFEGVSNQINGIVSLINVILLWVGISVLMHSFPSTGDAKSLYESVLKNPDVPMITKVLVAPFIGLIYVGAFGSVFWLDFIYAVAVATFAPRIFLLFL